jgi:hypothetical protein
LAAPQLLLLLPPLLCVSQTIKQPDLSPVAMLPPIEPALLLQAICSTGALWPCMHATSAGLLLPARQMRTDWS